MQDAASPYVVSGSSHWGPAWWRVLHGAALAYPADPDPEQRELMRGFLRGFFALVPCAACRERVEPPGDALLGRAQLVHWTLQRHALARAKLGRASRPMDALGLVDSPHRSF